MMMLHIGLSAIFDPMKGPPVKQYKWCMLSQVLL